MILKNNINSSRLKFAELISSLGAGVMGIGFGAIFSEYLKPFSVMILIIGLLSHAVGMFDKHKIENNNEVFQPAWAIFLYWSCWVGIIGSIIYLIFFQ